MDGRVEDVYKPSRTSSFNLLVQLLLMVVVVVVVANSKLKSSKYIGQWPVSQWLILVYFLLFELPGRLVSLCCVEV